MEAKIREMLPEIGWIKSPEIQKVVIDCYIDALKTGGWDPELGEELMACVLAVAGGKKTRNEENGFHDLAIFKQGVTL